MSKPVLLSGGNGKVSELAGDQNRQVLTWSEAGQDWVPGPGVSGSGGGGQTFFFNFGNTTGITPNSVLPQSTGSNPTTSPSLLGPTYNATSTSVTRADVPYSATVDTLIAGFVTTAGNPGVTQIFSGLWDFNIWMAATGAINGPTQMSVTARVYIMNGDGTAYGNASGGAGGGVALATSDQVYLYDQQTLAQYILNVTMPQTTILATDRIYIELYARRNESSGNIRGIDIRFETARPSHVHTTIQVPVNLATDVSGILPIANGGTGANTLTQYGVLVGNATSPVTVTAVGTAAQYLKSGAGAANPAFATIQASEINGLSGTYAPLASPTFTGTVTIPTGANISGYATTASLASYAPLASPTFTGTVTIPAGASISGFAPLASPTFLGTPSLPTGTTGITQSAGNSSTALATTSFVTTAVATSSGAPYDLPAEIPGTPPVSTKVVNFKAVRAFTLTATGHQGGQLTNPSADVACTVRKNATTLGTITFGASSFSSNITGTLVERTFAAGDILSIQTPSDVKGIDTPFFTLLMTLA